MRKSGLPDLRLILNAEVGFTRLAAHLKCGSRAGPTSDAIHAFFVAKKDVDARHKAGHDGEISKGWGSKAMLIKRQEDVTDVVVDAFKNAPDPRVREILSALVKHLHAFARDVHLT